MTPPGALRGRIEDHALLWWVVLAVGVLSVLPLARLLLEGVAPGGVPSAGAIERVLRSPVTWTAARHSIVTAVGATLLAAAIGGTVAMVVSLADVRARNAFVFCF